MAVLLLGAVALCPGAAADGLRQAGTPQDVFGQPMAGVNSAVLAKFNYGLGLFRHARDPQSHADGTISGIGPLHNARSCVACHIRDGRGAPPDWRVDDTISIVFNLVGPTDGDPIYGAQIQDRAVDGLRPEGKPGVRWIDVRVALGSDETLILRRPEWVLDDLGDGPLEADTAIDARVAPQLVGMGLLEAVDPATIAALADPDDRDGDGISGRTAGAGQQLGRFGWRATAPSLAAQTEKAAHYDMGLRVPGYDWPGGDCTVAQTACLARAADSGLDLSATDIALIGIYLSHLEVPARRDSDKPQVREGQALFGQLGCAACHVAQLRTGASTAPDLAHRDIAPYTDLLLHDMGPGLAGPAGAEWRTPPLWGIGLTQQVSGHNYLLHDGRARGFVEAIVWHGGEAQAARDGFARLSSSERAALIAFLASL